MRSLVLVGGEYATVLTERAVFRATYTGPPLICSLTRLCLSAGVTSRTRCATPGTFVFFLSSDGFYSFNGQRISPIGSERINQFFLTILTVTMTIACLRRLTR